MGVLNVTPGAFDSEHHRNAELPVLSVPMGPGAVLTIPIASMSRPT